MELLKRWKTLIPILTLVGVLGGFLWKRALSPPPEELVIRPPPAAQIPALELPPRARSLSGTVAAPDGTGVPDALVWLRASDAPHWTYTDGQGRFRLEAIESGPWFAKIVARGFDPVSIELSDAPAEQTIRLGPPLGELPRLVPLVRLALAGKVTSDLPLDLDGAEIVLTPTLPPETLNGALPRRLRVAADGRFAASDLLTGEYWVEVVPAWARGGSWPDLARALDAREPRRLSHGPETEGQEFSIALATGAAQGRLVDLLGSPVEGALILVATSEDAGRVWPPVSSQSDGSFTVLGLPAGEYALSIRAGSAAVQQTIRIEPGKALDLGLAPLEVRPGR